ALASPAATISAIVLPTGTTSPACAVTSRRMPDAGASISTVTLSVSISTMDSPLMTRSPGDLIQRRTLPVSCAISSAGRMTFVGIALGDSTAQPGLELGRHGREANAGDAGRGRRRVEDFGVDLTDRISLRARGDRDLEVAQGGEDQRRSEPSFTVGRFDEMAIVDRTPGERSEERQL